MEEKQEYRVYQVEVGATYWIAARSLQEGIATAFEIFKADGSLEDVISSGSFEINQISDEEIDTLEVYDVSSGMTLLMRKLLGAVDHPMCICCSEW